jgi:hypothetical protein
VIAKLTVIEPAFVIVGSFGAAVTLTGNTSMSLPAVSPSQNTTMNPLVSRGMSWRTSWESSDAYRVIVDAETVIAPPIWEVNRDARSGVSTVAEVGSNPAIADSSPVRSVPASSSALVGAEMSAIDGTQYTCRVPGG